MVESLLPGHSELVEDVVVRAACEYSCLLDPHVLYDLEVFLLGSDPGRDLRELKSEVLTGSDRGLVPVAVCKEFSLSDDSVRS